jgi:hypothetical protein
MMFRVNLYKATFLIILSFQFLNMTYSQEPAFQKLRIMFYNVENLFDIYDDSLKNDDEFLPEGLRRWNSDRYYKKLNSIFRTIVAAGEWSPPEIIGFSEIENRKVLDDLIHNTYLSRYSYGIVHEDSPDLRGIDVGLIYRKDMVSILDYNSCIPQGYNKETFNTRSVLHVKCVILGDTAHFLINHWPSRLGGKLANEDLRTGIAEMVRGKIDSINFNSNGKARIVIMGDFNCKWNDKEMKILTDSALNYNNADNFYFINLSEKLAKNGIGSYRYHGIWEMIDQVIVSDYLINCGEGLNTNEDYFEVFNPGFLLKRDSKFPGFTPYPTFLGYRYQGGYSDHLPVLLELRVK